MTSLNLERAQFSLKGHQTSFKEIATRPNTLERNVELAEHRTEIGRLEKLIAKLAPRNTLPQLAVECISSRENTRVESEKPPHNRARP